MEHPWFERVEWDAILNKKVRPPFKPKLQSDADVKYIDPEFTTAQVDESIPTEDILSGSQQKWDGFTYMAESALK